MSSQNKTGENSTEPEVTDAPVKPPGVSQPDASETEVMDETVVEPSTAAPTQRSGFVCLTGPTNAGKSTLMNAVIGQKISIITPKPQTTRNRILGIHSVERGQIIFVDTPGLHRAEGGLGRRMNDLALRSLDETEVALLVVDVSLDAKRKRGLSNPNKHALRMVLETDVPIVVALNKVDQVKPKKRLLPIMQAYADAIGDRGEVLPISALRDKNLQTLEDVLFARLAEGPPLYPTDMLSDQAERFLAAEIVREKLMLETHQELPYAVAVEVEAWLEPGQPNPYDLGGKKGHSTGGVPDSLLRIAVVIHVERDSQKGIVIGKGGERLKSIGSKARADMAEMFGTKVFLELFVRVEKNWTNDARRLDRFGY